MKRKATPIRKSFAAQHRRDGDTVRTVRSDYRDGLSRQAGLVLYGAREAVLSLCAIAIRSLGTCSRRAFALFQTAFSNKACRNTFSASSALPSPTDNRTFPGKSESRTSALSRGMVLLQKAVDSLCRSRFLALLLSAPLDTCWSKTAMVALDGSACSPIHSSRTAAYWRLALAPVWPLSSMDGSSSCEHVRVYL